MSSLSLVGLLVLAVSSQAVPPAPPTPTPPRAVISACDLTVSLARGAAGVSTKRRTGTFRDERLAAPVVGCEVQVTGSFKRAKATGAAVERVRIGFEERGWAPLPNYDADGKDGTAFAFQKGDVACLFTGEWDGGSDDEPALAADDWYRMRAVCTSPVPSGLGR